MIPPKVRAVFVKELRDTLRDRRTIVATVVVPLLLYPIMLLGMAELAKIAKAKIDRETYDVAIPVGTISFFEGIERLAKEDESKPAVPNPDEAAKPQMPGMAGEMLNAPKLAPPLTFREMPPDVAQKELTAGKVRAVVSIPVNMDQMIASQQPVTVEVQFDDAEHQSREASARLNTLFDFHRKRIVAERLKARDLTSEFLNPFQFRSGKTVTSAYAAKNVAAASKVGGSMLGSFLPLLFIMMIIGGAIGPATDMTAGEKDRSTLETLIGSPVRPVEIITGKFLAVATIAMGSAALNVGSCAATLMLMPVPKSGSFDFPWAALPLTLLLLIPLALFFSGLLLAFSSFAANQKEAQIYALPVYLIPVLGMMVVLMPGIELEGPLLFAPVVNTALLIKQLFIGKGTVQQIGFVFLSTCMYAAGAVVLAARIFAREEVLFSAQGSMRLFLTRRFFVRSPEPRPGDSLLVAALLFPIYFYLQLWLSKMLFDPEVGFSTGQFAFLVIFSQYLLFLVLPLAVAWYLKVDLKRTFLWKNPPLSGLLGAFLTGCSSWLVVQQLVAWQSHFWDFTPQDLNMLEKALGPLFESVPGLLLLVFLLGVTPAICEEHLFRGFLQQGLRRTGKWTTLITVGVIFGAYHISLFQQPVLMLMGVLLAYLAWNTQSIWPGVLFHFMHNSISVLAQDPRVSKPLGMPAEKFVAGQPLANVPTHLLVPAVILFGLGIVMIWYSGRKTASAANDPLAPSSERGTMPVPTV